MAGQPLPSVKVSENASGVGIIVPGVGALPVNVAGWCSQGPSATPTPVGVGAVPALKSQFGVGPAVELAGAILANGAPQGVIVTRIYDGTIASPFAHTGSGTSTAVTASGSPMAPYGNPTSTGSTGPIVFIELGGAIGTAMFQVSLDGGGSFSPAQLIPGSPGLYEIPNTGITLTFSPTATYVTGDTYVGAITTSTGASYTLVNNVNTLMVAGTTNAQQIAVPGGSLQGAGSVQMDTTNNPQDAYQVILLIASSGVLGVGTFEYSIDGGLTFSAATQIPGNGGPTPIGATGINVDWFNVSSGSTLATYVWTDSTDSDSVTFQAGAGFPGAAGNNLRIVVATGAALGNSVSVAGSLTTVTITIDTGVTTPALLATYVNVTAAAQLSQYVTVSAHTGTTPFSVFLSSTPLTGGSGPATEGFVAGETYVFTTVPPTITNTDILNVGEAITGNKIQWDWMHIAGRPTSISSGVAIFSTLDTIANFWFANGRFSFCVQDTPPCTQFANIENALVNAYASSASNFVAVGAGDCNIVSAISGAETARCASWAASIWGSKLNIGVDLAEEDLGNLAFVAHLLLDQNIDPTLTENGFTALRTIPTATGNFVANAFIFSSAQSDITFWQHRRVLNQACRIAYAALTTFLSKPVLVDPTTGFLKPAAANSIQDFLLGELYAGLSGQISGAAVVVGQTNDILTDETLFVTVGVVSLAYPKYVEATIGFINPALSTQ